MPKRVGHRSADRPVQHSSAWSASNTSSILTPSIDDSRTDYSDRADHAPVNLLADLLEQDSSGKDHQWEELAEELGIEGDFRWHVSLRDVAQLHTLPEKKPHSGSFDDWIGEEPIAFPDYLWDARKGRTIKATDSQLNEGYIAVSWTWGRYQLRDADGPDGKKWRAARGVPWRVPCFDKVDIFGQRKDRLTALKWVLHTIKSHRYFWVDILCINQNNDVEAQKERDREIAKQAKIFSFARGAFTWLWTIGERRLFDALEAFGDLLSWYSHFPDRLGRQASQPRRTIAAQDWPKLFNVLQKDHWFTSLWTLQEMVLAPASVWMTMDGVVAYINGKILTTRLFAIALRILFQLSQKRSVQWMEEERIYMLQKAIDRRKLNALKEEFASERNRERGHLRRAYAQAGAEGKRSGELLPIVELDPICGGAPWIIEAQRRERFHRFITRQWRDWATGQSCIDCSLSATRSAILLAGQNREYINQQSRERALLAALKVEWHSSFFSGSKRQAHHQSLSTTLLNVVLMEEGVKMFDIEHGALRLDLSDWVKPGNVQYLKLNAVGDGNTAPDQDPDTYTLVTLADDHLDDEVEFKRNGENQRVRVLSEGHLTSMSPSSGLRLNSQVAHFNRRTIQWEQHADWHMHDHGILHIPQGARIQKIKKADPITKIHFRPTGTDFDYIIERASDLKLISQTQKWLTEKFHYPTFILLPLGTRAVESHDTRLSDSQTLQRDPQVIGVVLVGNQTSLSKEMSIWHKFGIYHGWGEFEKLRYNGGILVADFHGMERSTASQHCKHFTTLASKTWAALKKDKDFCEDFEVLKM